MNYLDDLNESQRAAVTYMDGPSLVIAGAGSGKTRVLTYKIAYLLEHGYRAENILALTFTNKAAREMKDRIAHIVGAETARYLWMGTFHSICAKILRAEAEAIGYTRDYSIYDTQDSKSLIKSITKEMALDEKVYKPNVLLGRISDAKNILVSPRQYAENNDYNKRDRQDRLIYMAEIYHRYQEALRNANSMDFDDLLVQTCYLFRDHPEVLQKYQMMFRYVLVDEYQDTNYAQYIIVKQLAEPENMVCVVGDDAQSIYSFRGADIRNILSFQNGYQDARLFKLERNYRSTQTIVNAANSLIHKNQGQIFKNVYSEKEQGSKISLRNYTSDREEAEGIARLIDDDHRKQGNRYDEIAVLYRTNAQSRAFENELRKRNIPYRIYGGMSFYQRKEIKDALAYFRLAANPDDTEALKRAINTPARGIGDTTVGKLLAGEPLTGAAQKKVAGFMAMIDEFRISIDEKDAYAFAEEVLARSGLLTAAAMDTTPEGIDRKQNLEELMTGIREFVDQRIQQGIDFTPMADFIGEVALLTDQDENTDDHTPRVTLMTVHAAKGLEFPVVYIAGMEENLFPSQFCTSPRELEEERRLLYVAITRAMERCTLSYAGQRFKNGSLNFSQPSRFLSDIDRQYVERQMAAPSWQPRWQNSSWETHPQPLPRREGSNLTRLDGKTGYTSGAGGTDIANAPYTAGDRIYHRVFGDGSVLRVYRENDNDKIDILFDSVGKKTLLLAYAKLERK